jgi:hypothetical protein
MSRRVVLLLLFSGTLLVTGGAGHAAPAQTAAAGDGIAWFAGDVDAAFKHARAVNKPLFLYWGAVWCPPCNQVKSTIFNRQDFIERSRLFVPYYLDGDQPSAQKSGARFKVSGYPTMILFRPDGTEITRLPGEIDPQRYLDVLELGINATRPVRATLAAALAGGKKLGAADWQQLAFYGWDTDERRLLPKGKEAATLQRLAAACPPQHAEAGTRLAFKAAVLAAGKPGNARAFDKKASLARIRSVLADPQSARAHFDLVTTDAGEVASFLTEAGSPQRKELVAAWDPALRRLADDTSLSNADRLGALYARVKLAQIDGAAVPAPLLAAVRAEVTRADRAATDKYERQSVISAAAYLLATAGQLDESDALLKAELTRSHSPYYFMLALASNAKKRGDDKVALDWYEKAYAASQGPATRLQWGASYINALLDLAPDDLARIERALAGVLGELEPVPETFYDRNRRSLERIGRKLGEWNTVDERRAAVAQRTHAQMGAVCAKLPPKAPERAVCNSVLKPKA